MRRLLLLSLIAPLCQAQVTQQPLPSRVESLIRLPDRLETLPYATAGASLVPSAPRHPPRRPKPTHPKISLPQAPAATGVWRLKLSATLHLPPSQDQVLAEAPIHVPARTPLADAPDAVETGLHKAYEAYEAGRHAEAVAWLRSHMESLDAAGWEVLGWSHWHLDQPEEALQAFRQAYQLQPSTGAAQGLVLSAHALRVYAGLPGLQQRSPGPLDALISQEVRQAILQGERDFVLGPDLRLLPVPRPTAPATWTAQVRPWSRHKQGTPGAGRLHQAGLQLTLAYALAVGEGRLVLAPQHVKDGQDGVAGLATYRQPGAAARPPSRPGTGGGDFRPLGGGLSDVPRRRPIRLGAGSISTAK